LHAGDIDLRFGDWERQLNDFGVRVRTGNVTRQRFDLGR
jgi:hypothetical protein